MGGLSQKTCQDNRPAPPPLPHRREIAQGTRHKRIRRPAPPLALRRLRVRPLRRPSFPIPAAAAIVIAVPVLYQFCGHFFCGHFFFRALPSPCVPSFSPILRSPHRADRPSSGLRSPKLCFLFRFLLARLAKPFHVLCGHLPGPAHSLPVLRSLLLSFPNRCSPILPLFTYSAVTRPCLVPLFTESAVTYLLRVLRSPTPFPRFPLALSRGLARSLEGSCLVGA